MEVKKEVETVAPKNNNVKQQEETKTTIAAQPQMKNEQEKAKSEKSSFELNLDTKTVFLNKKIS